MHTVHLFSPYNARLLSSSSRSWARCKWAYCGFGTWKSGVPLAATSKCWGIHGHRQGVPSIQRILHLDANHKVLVKLLSCSVHQLINSCSKLQISSSSNCSLMRQNSGLDPAVKCGTVDCLLRKCCEVEWLKPPWSTGHLQSTAQNYYIIS
jgi:hypothetical protein